MCFVGPPLPTPLSDPPPPEFDFVEAPADEAAGGEDTMLAPPNVETGADLPLPFGVVTSAPPLEIVTAVVP